jgi:lipopolysaccharide transport system permease protein
MLIINSQRRWWQLDLGELWSYHELLWTLIVRDLKVRYKQTWLGIGWAILQPLLAAGIFTIFFSGILGNKLADDGVNYGAFVLCGFVFWNFFANALTTASGSVVEQVGLIKKIYFPRLFLPLTVIGRCLFDFAISFLCLIIVLLITHTTFYITGLLFSLLCLLILTILVTGLSSFFGALNVRYRDVKHVLPFLVQIGLYLSPVFYSGNILPTNLQWLMDLNPLAVIFNLIRGGLFTQTFDWCLLLNIALVSILICYLGLVFFKHTERDFADVA